MVWTVYECGGRGLYRTWKFEGYLKLQLRGFLGECPYHGVGSRLCDLMDIPSEFVSTLLFHRTLPCGHFLRGVDTSFSIPPKLMHSQIPTTTEEAVGDRGLALSDRPTVQMSVATLFLARVPVNCRQWTSSIDILDSDQHTLNIDHTDTLLYLHPEDVRTFPYTHSRVYDFAQRELGVIPIDCLQVLPPPLPPKEAWVYWTLPCPTVVFLNPTSRRPYLRFVRGTSVRGSETVGERTFVQTHSGQHRWIGRGWVGVSESSESSESSEPSEPSEPSKPSEEPGLAEVLWKQVRSQNRGQDVPGDPADVFSGLLLPGLLSNAYNTTTHYICPDAPDTLVMGRSETVSQPLAVAYQASTRSVHALLQHTTRSGTREALQVRKSVGLSSHRILFTHPSDRPPACLVLSVVRDLRPTQTVESFPLQPSEVVSFFGFRYRLVSFSLKSGSPRGGHWTACVRTKTGWFLFDDHCPARKIHDVHQLTNGVQFIYERETQPDLAFFSLVDEGLVNPGNRCWANTFTQMVRYCPTLASLIGVTHRIPTFNELRLLLSTPSPPTETRA